MTQIKFKRQENAKRNVFFPADFPLLKNAVNLLYLFDKNKSDNIARSESQGKS